MAEQLHGVPVGVDARQRNRNHNGRPGEGAGRECRRYGRCVGLQVGLAHRDAQLCPGALAVRSFNLVDRNKVARGGGGEVTEHLAGAEQQAGTLGEVLGQLRQQGQVGTVGLGVVVEHGDVDRRTDPHGDLVIDGDGRLQGRRNRDFHHGDDPLRIGEAIAHAVVEGHRAVERIIQPHPHKTLFENFGGDPRLCGEVVNTGDHQNTTGRIDVRPSDIHLLRVQALHKHGFRNGDWSCTHHGRRHIHTHQPGGRLVAVGHHVLEVVGAHRGAGDTELAAFVTRHNVHPGLRRHTAETQCSVAAAHVLEGADGGLLAGGGENNKRVGDDGNGAGGQHRDVEGAGGRCGAVRDRQGDRAGGLPRCGVLKQHHALGGERHQVRFAGGDAREIKRVTVGVDPVAEHLAAHTSAGFNGGFCGPHLLRGLVLLGAAHGHGRCG